MDGQLVIHPNSPQYDSPLPKNNSHQNHFDTIIPAGLFSAEKYLASFSVPLHSMMQFGGLYFLQ